MEKIQLIREDCAWANLFAVIKRNQIVSKWMSLFNRLEFFVPFKYNNRFANPWGIDGCAIDVYNTLMDKNTIAGFEIGGDFYYLTDYSWYRYIGKDDGIQVLINGIKYIKSDAS